MHNVKLYLWQKLLSFPIIHFPLWMQKLPVDGDTSGRGIRKGKNTNVGDSTLLILVRYTETDDLG